MGESFSVLMNGEKSKEGRKKERRYKKWDNKVSRVSGEGKRSVYFLEQKKKVNMNICKQLHKNYVLMHFWDKTYLLYGTGKTPDMPRTSNY